jgi:hypothetical protein
MVELFAIIITSGQLGSVNISKKIVAYIKRVWN